MPSLALARDLFMFSLYMHGMTFLDMAKLKSKNVHKEVITYRTSSAKGTLVNNTIKLSNSISDIIDRYNKHSQPYISPITTEDESSTLFRVKVKECAKQVNKSLKDLAERIGITKNFSMLSARDTWHDMVEHNDIIGTLLESIYGTESEEKPDTKHHELVENAKASINDNESSEGTSQDRLWNKKWKAYMDYMSAYKHRPSKHKTEDLVLFDWFKHNKKLLNQGKLQEDRIDKLNQLLAEAKRLQRMNNYRYADGEKYTGEEKKDEVDEQKKESKVKVKKPVKNKEEKEETATKVIKLYNYQADMKERIEDAFQKYQSVMVQMPTGTCKTHVRTARTQKVAHRIVKAEHGFLEF